MTRRAFRLVSPGRLEIREGGGCLTLFGLPFFAAGVFLTLISLGVVPLSNGEEVPWFAWVILPLMGLAFVLVGGGLAFGRSWTAIDAGQRTLTRQWGLLVPMRVRSHPLEGFVSVAIGFEAGDSDTADRFPVALRGRSGGSQPIFSSTEYADARACAVEVARLLHIDVEDSTTDHVVRTSATQSELPLQHRLRLDSRDETVADRPEGARAEVDRDGAGVRISIPPPRTHPVAAVAGLLPLAIALAVMAPLSEFFTRTGTPDVVAWAFLGFLCFLFVLLPGVTFLNGLRRSRRGGTIVTVSPDGIHVADRGAWRTRTTATHAASDIIDVDFSTGASAVESARRAAQETVANARRPDGSPGIGPRTERWLLALSRFARGRGITIKTRSGLTTIGHGLDDAEIRHLHGLIRRALVGTSDRTRAS